MGKINNNRYLVLIIILFITSIIVNFIRYDLFLKSTKNIAVEKNIPLELEEWKGKDLLIEDRIYEILETNTVIQRIYSSKEKDVLLSIVYYPDLRIDFHAPEACLGGKGIEIRKSIEKIYIEHEGKKKKISLNQLIWTNNNTQNLVYYFYKSGDFIGHSYLKLRFKLALSKLTDREKSGSLIRISTPIPHGEIKKGDKILTNFINDLYPFIIKYL